MEKHAILAVDDERINLRMLERLFHRDYRVLTAACGEEALRILEREEVALIITDQQMPGMTGAELLRMALELRPNAASILLSGYTDIETRIEGIDSLKVYKCLSKPWDPPNLKDIVKGALGER
jgi:response regulator RpfG family c-di-GMP phosphodiesterase